MIDCNDIYFDVRAFDELNDITYPPPEFDEEGRPVNFVFEPGAAEQYTVMRASVHHQFITPFMDKLFHMGPDLPAIVNAFVRRQERAVDLIHARCSSPSVVSQLTAAASPPPSSR